MLLIPIQFKVQTLRALVKRSTFSVLWCLCGFLQFPVSDAAGEKLLHMLLHSHSAASTIHPLKLIQPTSCRLRQHFEWNSNSSWRHRMLTVFLQPSFWYYLFSLIVEKVLRASSPADEKAEKSESITYLQEWAPKISPDFGKQVNLCCAVWGSVTLWRLSAHARVQSRRWSQEVHFL